MTNRRDFLKDAAALVAAPLINRGWFAPFPGAQERYSTRCLDLMKRALVIDMLSPLHLSGRTRDRWLGTPDSFSAADAARFRTSGIHVFHAAVGWGGPDA